MALAFSETSLRGSFTVLPRMRHASWKPGCFVAPRKNADALKLPRNAASAKTDHVFGEYAAFPRGASGAVCVRVEVWSVIFGLKCSFCGRALTGNILNLISLSEIDAFSVSEITFNIFSQKNAALKSPRKKCLIFAPYVAGFAHAVPFGYWRTCK